jgi:ribonuclease BN (tRNA processing enzyme)
MNAFRITILGSGTCVPSLKRSSCSVIIYIEDTILLFDLGAGSMRRILEAGIDMNKISYIIFSHLHPDHTGELASFIFASKYPETYRRRGRLTIIGAVGIGKFYEGLKNVYGHWIQLEEDMLEIIEMSNSRPDFLSLGFSDLNTIPVEHDTSSIGYRVTLPDGASVVYTGDLDYSEEAVGLARDVDLLICESALPDDMKVAGHLTPSLAGRIAAEANVRNLMLTHFYPECENVDIEAQCRKTYRGNLILAEDLMQLEISKKGMKRIKG